METEDSVIIDEETCLKNRRHELYQKTVQNPKREVEFYRKIYRMIFNTVPNHFREDFCGTGRLSCEWVKNNVYNTAVGIDLDEETVNWGRENNINNLPSGSERIELIIQNVLEPFDSNKKFDIICSMNYSHYLLVKRKHLVTYFMNVRANIQKGIFIMDFFGGSHTFEEHEHQNQSDYYKFKNEQMNILNNNIICTLNFKTKEKKLETLFTYNFRIYSLIELKEALEESGFNRFKIFIKDVSDDEENTFQEYKEIDYNSEYYPELDRFNGENIYELVELILDEQFGKTVSLVGIALLNNGPSSILELMKLLSFDFAEVRDALIILLQNKLVLFQEASRKESLEIIYELDVDTFLNYLRFPKILYFINHHHDENAMLIFEEFMQFGILSAGQVFEQVKDKLSQEGKDNPSAVNNMKLKFLQLIESGYLTQCSHKKPQELSEKKKKEDKKQMSAKKKKKAALLEDEEDKMFRNSPTSMVNAQIDDDNALIYNKEKGKYYYFCLNFDKIVIELKCEIVVDLITQKMGGQAGLISSIMLRKNAANAFREGKSTPITIEEILKQMGVNTKDKKILLDKTEAVRNLLEEMSREENDFVLLWSIIESGQTYCLNLESVSKTLKTKTLEKIIEQEFSPDHIRIYRLLSKCGPLDSKNIMEICLMPHKESSACINQMIEHGYIETQPINYKGSNVMFFNINTKSNLNLMIAKIYKVIKNLKYFLKSHIEKIKNTESQIRQEQFINKVYGTISELDDSVIVLKYF